MLVFSGTRHVLYYMLVTTEKLLCVFVLHGAFGMLEMMECGMFILWMSSLFFLRYKLTFKNGGSSIINTKHRKSHVV